MHKATLFHKNHRTAGCSTCSKNWDWAERNYLRHTMTGVFLTDIQTWAFSGQELKSQLQISLSLGGILNSTPDVGRGVYLTSYCEQLTGKVKFTNLKVPKFLQSAELDSLINFFIWETFQMLSGAAFQICNFVFQNILPWSSHSRKISK